MIINIYNTDRKYNLILADPPWKQAKGGKKSVRANSSGKPEISFDIIKRLYPTERKLELYARRTRDGWDCWGNEVGDNGQ